jgi:hypothetical protein
MMKFRLDFKIICRTFIFFNHKKSMIHRFRLSKMDFINKGSEHKVIPHYYIRTNDGDINLNNLVGIEMKITHTSRITCSACGKITRKSYGQGYCYPCFISVPETEDCVLRPELCMAHEGIARDMSFATRHCLINHIVYLALSGGLKVGVTRFHQVPTRWVDQGAVRTIKLIVTPNRYSAGIAEVSLKEMFADKTNWRKMLQGIDEEIDLAEMKRKALKALSNMGIASDVADDLEYWIDYPVKQYPQSVSSINFDKSSTAKGKLMGIKGQYLIFESNEVLNIRTHTGYEVEMEY